MELLFLMTIIFSTTYTEGMQTRCGEMTFTASARIPDNITLGFFPDVTLDVGTIEWTIICNNWNNYLHINTSSSGQCIFSINQRGTCLTLIDWTMSDCDFTVLVFMDEIDSDPCYNPWLRFTGKTENHISANTSKQTVKSHTDKSFENNRRINVTVQNLDDEYFEESGDIQVLEDSHSNTDEYYITFVVDNIYSLDKKRLPTMSLVDEVGPDNRSIQNLEDIKRVGTGTSQENKNKHYEETGDTYSDLFLGSGETQNPSRNDGNERQDIAHHTASSTELIHMPTTTAVFVKDNYNKYKTGSEDGSDENVRVIDSVSAEYPEPKGKTETSSDNVVFQALVGVACVIVFIDVILIACLFVNKRGTVQVLSMTPRKDAQLDATNVDANNKDLEVTDDLQKEVTVDATNNVGETEVEPEASTGLQRKFNLAAINVDGFLETEPGTAICFQTDARFHAGNVDTTETQNRVSTCALNDVRLDLMNVQ